MQRRHAVQFIPDDTLPEGFEWALAEVGDEITFLVEQSHVRPEVLEEAWAAYRLLAAS